MHENTMVSDLPERLREGTRDLHRLAERSGLMARMLAGRIDVAAYGALLRNLHALYASLEAALRAAQADATVARLPLAGLWREPALAADLAALQGPGWRDGPPCCAATQDYARRLQALAGERPAALVAHAYLRYLGDLHGGQILQRQLLQCLGAGTPTSFYDFGPPEQVMALRTQFRGALAGLPLSAAGAEALVEEARWGFRQHQRIFEAVDSA